MKNIIFHIPQKLDPNRHSASQIRPRKLLEAFQLSGYSVDLIEGDGALRAKQISEVKRKINMGVKYEFLYSESSTMPTLLTESHHLPLYPCLDFSFFKYCKKHHIPIGLFYRDIYWCFKENQKTLKAKVSRWFYQYDLIQYKKYVDTLFVPSVEMLDYIPNLLKMNAYALPSGAKVVNHPVKNIDEVIQILYIGGVGSHYNLKLIVEAVSENPKFHLTICARKAEWEGAKEEYSDFMTTNVSVVFAKGDELNELYAKADLFCLYVAPDEYRKFAVPFKLFESIGHGVPFIVSKNTFCGNFIEKNEIGFVANYSKDDIKSLFDNIIINKEKIKEYQNNVVTLRDNNTWQYRVVEIEAQLLHFAPKSEV